MTNERCPDCGKVQNRLVQDTIKCVACGASWRIGTYPEAVDVTPEDHFAPAIEGNITDF